MNLSFWSHCQGLVRRLQKRRLARPRERQAEWYTAETLEYRCLLSAVPAPSGVVAWWSGDGTATDQLGLNDGILANGAGFAAGQVDGGFNFDGVDDNFQAPTAGLPTGNADRTIELWVRIDQQLADETCFAFYGAPGSPGQAFALGTVSSGELFVSNWGNAIFGPALQNGQWYHVAATNVGDTFTLYLDGVEVGTDTMSLDTPAGSTFWLGRLTDSDIGGVTRRLDGMVDEVTVYDRALSASEIATIHDAGSDGKFKAPTPSFGVSGFPATMTAGSAGSFTITAKNADETTNTGYLGTVHFSSSDPQAVLPADYTFTAADHGAHTFTAQLKTAGAQSVTARDTQAPGMDGTQSNILVKAAAASTLTVGGFPSATAVGVAGNITVTAKDPYGNIASGYTGTVHFTSSDPQAALPADDTFTALDAGQRTFSVTIKTAGTQSITATDTLSAGFTGTQGGITVWGRPVMVGDINPGPASANPGNLLAIGSTIYFPASDSTHGQELWKSNGTPAGTMLVKDLNLGAGSSSPGNLTNVNGTLYFTASDGMKGVELWKSNGTPAGTMMVKDLNLGAGGSSPRNLTNVNGTLYFTASDGASGEELWKSDGTAAGTVRVKDISPGGGTSSPQYLTNVNGTLFFTADDGTTGGLWKSDGTPAGTVRIGPAGSSKLTNVNGTLFFTTGDETNGQELWKSDGTVAGTTIVTDIYPGQYVLFDYYGNIVAQHPYSSSPKYLTNVNGTLFFSAWTPPYGWSLWKSDGTATGTVPVKDVTPFYSSSPDDLTNVNGTLYFTAGEGRPPDGVAVRPHFDGTYGQELWKSDGTAAGTVLVKGIDGIVGQGLDPGGATYPHSMTNVNGTLFFTTVDGAGAWNLWLSDGTPAGTGPVANLNANSLTNLNGTLFFSADDGVHGSELWALSTVATPSLGLSGFPATTTAGSTGSFTITAKNIDGTTNAGYLGTVHFTSSDPQAVLPGDYTFTAADHGVHTFTAILKTAGSQSITAMDTQVLGVVGTQSDILIKVAAASTMTVGNFPSTTTVGEAGNLTVTLKDPYGNIASGYTGTVRLTSSDPQAALPANYTFTAADGGQHTFSVTLKTAGTQSITVADTLNSALTATQGGLAVNPILDVSGFPTTITAGSAGSFTIRAKNADGTTYTGYRGTVRFTSTDPQAVLPADYTFIAADNGVHTFTAKLKTAGYQSITATDTQGIAGAESSILVKAAAASTMTVGGFPSTATAGAAGNLTVTLNDPYGNVASGYTGTVRFTSSDPQAALPANYTFTAADAGTHTFSVMLKTAGTRSITVADTLNAVLTATQGSITVKAGAASQFLISAPSSVTAGTPFSLTLTVKDAWGNVVTGYTGTVRFTSANKPDKLPSNYTFTAADQGMHTFTGLMLRKKGNQKITITDTLNGSLTANVTINVR